MTMTLYPPFAGIATLGIAFFMLYGIICFSGHVAEKIKKKIEANSQSGEEVNH